MECTWFFGSDLRNSAIIISVLGIVHPAFWALPAHRFRSEWFITLYVLTGGWCLVSILLLVGVLADVVMLYWIWIWFSIVFVPVMIIGMIVMIVGFCVLRMRIIAICPAFGLIYYILTIYCLCVVNTQRRDMLHERAALAGRGRAGPVLHERAAPAGAAPAGADPAGRGRAGHVPAKDAAAAERNVTRALRGDSLEVSLAPNTTKVATTALLTPTIKPPRRGSCVLPARQPANGVYMAALPNNKVALPGRGYRRLRLWLYCDKYFKPRHLQYSFCYSGGWNLPLPECVKDDDYYEVYFDKYNPDTTTTKPNTSACAVPPPPAHGHFMRVRGTKRYMQLAVRCNALHYLVGWKRITCHDGAWDRPVPSCVFTDTSVCTLPKSNDKMVRTCLAGALYAAAYRCDAGLVPHGAVLEPRCRRDHYVWGPFHYLYCVNGVWHPTDNITCEHAADIYSHYEIEAKRKTSTTTMAADGDDGQKRDNVTAASAAAATTRRLASSSTKPDTPGIWKTQTEADHFLSSNPATISIWKSRGETNNSLSTNSNKIDITDIWKAQVEAFEALSANSMETSIWKLPNGEAFIDNSIEPDRKSAAGSVAGTKLANMGERPSLRDLWFSVDTIESQIESDESLVDNLIRISTRNPRNKNEGPLTTNAIEASIWKPVEGEGGGESSGGQSSGGQSSGGQSSGGQSSGGQSSGGPSGRTHLWKSYGGPANSMETSIWKLPNGEAFIDNSIEPDRKSAAGSVAGTKLANMGERPSLRDLWFSVDTIESQIESDESLVDNLIRISTRNPRNKNEGPLTTNAIEASIWKPVEGEGGGESSGGQSSGGQSSGGQSSGGPSGRTHLWKSYGGPDESRTISNKTSHRKSRKYADKWLSVDSNTRRNHKKRRVPKSHNYKERSDENKIKREI